MEWFEYKGLPTIGVVKETAFTFMDISGIGVEAPRDSTDNGLLVYLYRKYNNTRIRLYFFFHIYQILQIIILILCQYILIIINFIQ